MVELGCSSVRMPRPQEVLPPIRYAMPLPMSLLVKQWAATQAAK